MSDSDEEPRTAIAFPGIRPSPYAELGKFLLLNPYARRLTAVADNRLGCSVLDGYRQADGEYSACERVAFLIACLALAFWAEETQEVRADLCVGASFGDTAAAVYTGALDFADAVWLTARWNDCLAEYFAREHHDVVTQSFARTSPDRLGEILRELTEAGEWHEVACQVDEDFWMLSVREQRLGWLNTSLRAAGGLPLHTMRPPMHASAFAPLRDTIEAELVSKLTFADPALPVVSDHDGGLLTSAGEVRRLLLDGVVRQVRWPDAMAALAGHGAARLVVSGPDGLWGRVDCARRAFEVVTLTPELALRPRPRTVAPV